MDDRKQLTVPSITGSKRLTFSYWMVWVLWLGFLIAPISSLLHSSPSPLGLILVLGSVALFVAIYLWTSMLTSLSLAAPMPPPPSSRWFMRWFPWPSIIILTLLAFAVTLVAGTSWGQLFFYVSACVGGCLTTPWAVRGIIVLDLLVGATILLSGQGVPLLLSTIFLMSVIGIVVISFVRSAITSRQLRAAREEIAYLAVAAERLRIARDLHDLLGHSLSLIALKSELAKRLATSAPERAAIEVSDIEQTAREALREVREAVTGYRQPTLTSELHEARNLLTAAGIGYRYDIDEQVLSKLSPALEAALSWTVREGVTNVIRHSRARQCNIRVAQTGLTTQVEITNDGPGTLITAVVPSSLQTREVGDESTGGGNGLRGLAERIAAIGGHYEAGPQVSGGFRLAVSVPTKEGTQ